MKTAVKIALFVAIVGLAGCDQVKSLIEPSAKDVLKNYLDASLSRKDDAYTYLSSRDQAIKTLEEYKGEGESNSEFFALFESSVSFSILSVSESGKTATADVEITMPNVREIFGELLRPLLGVALGENSENVGEKIRKTLADKYPNGEVPTTTKREEFRLLKEEGEWKVFLDWETKKTEKEKQAKIESLLADANKLRKSKKLSGAIERYEEILALNGEMVEAKKGIEETKEEIQDVKEKQAYLSKLVLYDLVAKRYESYLHGTVPGVEFKIQNNGNRTLSKVEVTVYFKDVNDVIIAEKEYRPITKSSLFGGGELLKPNYIWQMEQGKFYRAESVPDEWKEGAASASITDIEFLEENAK